MAAGYGDWFSVPEESRSSGELGELGYAMGIGSGAGVDGIGMEGAESRW